MTRTTMKLEEWSAIDDHFLVNAMPPTKCFHVHGVVVLADERRYVIAETATGELFICPTVLVVHA